MPIFGEGALATILTRINTVLGLVQTPVYWRTQLPVDYLDNTLVINTWEPVSANLSGGIPAALKWIMIEQTNNGVAVETLELEITINGTPYTRVLNNIASGAIHYIFVTRELTAGDFTLNSSDGKYSAGGGGVALDVIEPFYVESVGLIRVRQTSVVDPAGAQIEVNVIWEKLTRAPAM